MKEEEIKKIREMINKYQKDREDALYRACFLGVVYLDELVQALKDLIKNYE
jgi:hypothetical protein